MNFYEQLFCRGKTTGEGMTHFERLFAAKFGGSPAPEVREYTGAVPVTIIADGTPLLDYLITGNTTQSGTPTPDSPIMLQGCGELETVGAKVGQYKIPISSADTTTNNYLGEVETTRKIKKLVLTGDEAFSEPGTYPGGYLYMFVPSDIPGDNGANAVSTHYKQAYNNNKQNVYIQNGRIVIIDATHSTRNDFKTYLAQQYAAGTPVTIWYVLAAETTGIVNEPLMKIEDYADVVNNISIPTTDGANTLSVDTTVRPSEVSINYHGWHMGTVHERTAGQWD